MRIPGIQELRVRGGQLLLSRLERHGLFRPATTLVEGATRDWRAAGMPSSIAAGSAGIRQLAQRSAAENPGLAERWRQRSSQIRSGNIDILGCGTVAAGNPPRWHREAVSGIEAPRYHWSRIPTLDKATVGDHKVLWEINRHQYLLAPALLWNLTLERQHAELVQQHLESWLQENPPGYGANWTSSLEVAYRGISWCWLLWLLQGADWDASLRERLLASLELHGLHVERYLSTYYSPNTHLTGEALGLFYMGGCLSQSRHASRWRRRGSAILETWLQRQVYPDGVYFEQATQYQRYTAEIYLHYLVLARGTGWNVGESVPTVLRKVLQVLQSLATADRIPLLGDDDGGSLLPLDFGSPENIASLMMAGAATLGDPALLPRSRDTSLSLWLAGAEATDSMRSAPPSLPGPTVQQYPDGGYVVFRGQSEHGENVFIVDAGPHGTLNCGHAHADALSAVLSIAGRPLFVDRGTLTYVGEERNEFRSTLSHNTMEFDAESSVQATGPFQWRGIAPRPVASTGHATPYCLFEGASRGHLHTSGESLHRRSVACMPDSAWVIHDKGSRPGCIKAIVRWQLAADLRAEWAGEQALRVVSAAGHILARIAFRGFRDLRVSSREISPRFGARRTAQVIECITGADLEGLTVIVAGDGAWEAGSTEAAISWQDGMGTCRVLWKPAPEDSVCASGAVAAWIRESTVDPVGPCVLFSPQRIPPPAAVTDFTVADGFDGRVLVLGMQRGVWNILGDSRSSQVGV
jgi:hypothetical protein